MAMSIKVLARTIDARVLGNSERAVSVLRAIEDATHDAVCPLFQKRLLDGAPELPAAVVATKSLASVALARGVSAALVHEVPVLALARLIDVFHPPEAVSGKTDDTAVIHPSASVHPTAVIGPRAVVEQGVTIGAGSVVGPGAVICRNTLIGEGVRIGPGAVIGHEGFGFVPLPTGPVKVRQVGRVVLEDGVEVGANACIDRATLGTTRIGRNTKIDNLVQIGHNVSVGEGVMMAGQVGVAGSCTIGDGVLIGGQAGIADHLTIGKGAHVAAKSGVTRHVKNGEEVAGYPAMTRAKWQKAMANLARSSIVKPDTEE